MKFQSLEAHSSFRMQGRTVQVDREIKSVLVTFFFTEISLIIYCQLLAMKMAEFGQKTENEMC